MSGNYHLGVRGLARRTIALYLISMALNSLSSPSCPPSCECRNTFDVTKTTSTVVCSHRKFTSLPRDLPTNCDWLDLSFNNVTSLDELKWQNLTELFYLDVSNNLLTDINRNSFQRVSKLVTLKLANNRIRFIYVGVFSSLSRLRYLDLSGNQLVSLPSYLFSGLQLIELRLNDSKITSISAEAFQNSTIQDLSLANNQLREIRREMFISLLTSLKRLSLASNVGSLIVDSLAYTKFEFDWLNVSDNDLGSVEFLKFCSVNELDLSANSKLGVDFRLSLLNDRYVKKIYLREISLRSLNEDTFEKFESLTLLDLSGNGLEIMDAQIFRNSIKLETLILERNKLNSIPANLGSSSLARSLARLRLSYNSISSIQPRVFDNLRNLVELDMRFNKISTFDASLRPLFLRLQPYLQLDGNPVHCNCEVAWLRTAFESVTNRTSIIDWCATPSRTSFWQLRPEEFRCDPPQIDLRARTPLLHLGEELSLTCSALGDPTPNVELISPKSVSFGTAGGTSWIVQVTSEDGGYYVCRASNVLGTVEKRLCVQVIAPNVTPPCIAKSSTTLPVTTTITTITTSTTPITPSTADTFLPSTILQAAKLEGAPVNAEQEVSARGSEDLKIGLTIAMVVLVIPAAVVLALVFWKRRRLARKYQIHKNGVAVKGAGDSEVMIKAGGSGGAVLVKATASPPTTPTRVTVAVE